MQTEEIAIANQVQPISARAKPEVRLIEATWDPKTRQLAFVVTLLETSDTVRRDPTFNTYLIEEIGQEEAEWLVARCGTSLHKAQ